MQHFAHTCQRVLQHIVVYIISKYRTHVHINWLKLALQALEWTEHVSRFPVAYKVVQDDTNI